MSIFNRKLERLAEISLTELSEILPAKPGDYSEAPELLEADMKLIKSIVAGAFKHRDEGMPMEWDFAEAVDRLRGGPPK